MGSHACVVGRCSLICTMYERGKDVMREGDYYMKIGKQRGKVRDGDQGYYW